MRDYEEEEMIQKKQFSEKFAKIIVVSKKIARVYKEIDYGVKNDSLFKQLKELKEEEDSLYKQLNLDLGTKVTLDILRQNLEIIYGKNINNTFGAVCNDNIDDLWLHRIAQKLSYKPMDELRSITSQILNEKLEISMANLESIQEDQLEEVLNRDFIRAFVYFLDDEIKNTDNQALKNNLIVTRYKLTYISSLLEEQMINNGNSSDKYLYMTFGCICDLLQMPKDFVCINQEEISLTYVDNALGNLEMLNNFDNDNEKLKTIFKVYLRAGLALLYNNDAYELIIDELKSDILSNGGEEVLSSVDKYFDIDNKDVIKCKYLSFLNPNNQ